MNGGTEAGWLVLALKIWLLNFQEFCAPVVKTNIKNKITVCKLSIKYIKNKGNKYSKLTTC